MQTKVNAALASYVNAAWTDLFTAGGKPETLGVMSIVNTSGGAIVAEVRLADESGTAIANLMAAESVPATSSNKLDLAGLQIANQKVQVKAATAGIHFVLGLAPKE